MKKRIKMAKFQIYSYTVQNNEELDRKIKATTVSSTEEREDNSVLNDFLYTQYTIQHKTATDKVNTVKKIVISYERAKFSLNTDNLKETNTIIVIVPGLTGTTQMLSDKTMKKLTNTVPACVTIRLTHLNILCINLHELILTSF